MPEHDIALITDSTCDLTHDEIAALDVHIVPLTMTLDGKTYRDSFDIHVSEFYKLMEQSENLPTTSQPSPAAFIEKFTELYQQGYKKILVLTISSGLSGTFTSACQAVNQHTLDQDIRVVDSKATSGMLALDLMYACELRDKDVSLDELEEKVTEYCKHARVFFLPMTLVNLVKGGRLSRMGKAAADLLDIKVIVSVNSDGGAYVSNKARGVKRAIAAMVKQAVDFNKEHGKLNVMIGAADMSNEFIDDLRARLHDAGVDFVDKGIFRIGSVISTHTGLGAYGLAIAPATDE